MTDKPRQTRITDNHSNDALLEALDNAMWHIREAMDELKGCAEFENWFNALDDIDDEMQTMKDECERNAEIAYTEMVGELTREYYRSVI